MNFEVGYGMVMGYSYGICILGRAWYIVYRLS